MRGDGMGLWRTLRGGACVLIALYLLAPLVIVVIISFSSAPFLRFPPPGLSLRWYHRLLSDPSWLDAIGNSITVLIPASILATLLGTSAAYGLVRGRIPGASIVFACLMLPIVVPAIITAAALYGVYARVGLNGTITGLVIGHTILITPYVVATVGAALRTLDPTLENAAATLGAPPWAGFRRVTLPLILPSILSGLLFAMVVSFDELLVSLFVSTARTRTVPVLMWSNVRGDFDPTIAAIATLSFGLAVLALLLELALRPAATAQTAR
jgi:putative spermidine/putrescine transport system permease protein